MNKLITYKELQNIRDKQEKKQGKVFQRRLNKIIPNFNKKVLKAIRNGKIGSIFGLMRRIP